MTGWEYKHIKERLLADFTHTATKLGVAGWELINFHMDPSTVTGMFKRLMAQCASHDEPPDDRPTTMQLLTSAVESYLAHLQSEHDVNDDTVLVAQLTDLIRTAHVEDAIESRPVDYSTFTMNNYPVSVQGSELTVHTQPKQMVANGGKVYLTVRELRTALRLIEQHPNGGNRRRNFSALA